jgi:conjugal transfer mating pair stabilization protein TraN
MRLLAGLVLSLLLAAPSYAQTATSQARADGKTFGDTAGKAATDVANDENNARNNLPGYNGGNAPESTFLNNSGALDAAKITAAQSPESRLVIDGSTTRPKVPQVQVDQTVARGDIINQNPSTYVQGVDPQGQTGQCVELPATSTSPGTFEATCNAGSQVVQESKACSPSLVPSTTTTSVYSYWVAANNVGGSSVPRLSTFQSRIGTGVCVAQQNFIHFCDAQVVYGAGGGNVQAYLRFCKSRINAQAQEYVCSEALPNAEIEQIPDQFVAPSTGQYWFRTSTQSVTTVARDDSVCNPLASDPNCIFQGPEVCTDSSPQTRDVNGTTITQPCWAWRRDYQCTTIKPANDCADLEANAACHFDRTICLDDPRQGACKVEERIYTCPIPGNVAGDKQYLCGGDFYCVGGECEAVTREASDEFKDAAVGMETLAQVNREFDEVDYKLFKGTAMSCHKPVFGLVNCCAGKSSGLLTGGAAVAATAALSAGPGAIAGVATQFLVLFLCSPSEMELDVRDRLGLCHEIGWYCSGSFLGICHSKRRSSCCFLSKLTRVLQEQGRAQIAKSWGTTKKPDCSGFTINEFALLDLSKMDFSEVYQDFIDAAKVPDEAATMTDIQNKIRAYYSKRGH